MFKLNLDRGQRLLQQKTCGVAFLLQGSPLDQHELCAETMSVSLAFKAAA